MKASVMPVGLVAVIMMLLSACGTPVLPAGPFVKYAVSGQTVTVLGAVTPFDHDTKARDSFLHWFKRGFESGLAGSMPLMIEWDNTPGAKAGQRGYDLGLEEGGRYREKPKAPGQPPQIVPIPPA